MNEKKNLVLYFEIPFDPENEQDILRYCRELIFEAKNSPDFVKAEIDGRLVNSSEL